MLEGQYTLETKFDESDHRSHRPRAWLVEGLQKVDRLIPLCRERGVFLLALVKNGIHAALHEINLHLILGSVFASLVVFAFMRSWRSTLIAAVAIPSSVIATFGMMAALDFTLNSVTMLALVIFGG